jgi:hypothetical protein
VRRRPAPVRRRPAPVRRRPAPIRRMLPPVRRIVRHTSSHSHTSSSHSSKSVNVVMHNVRALSGMRQDIRDVTRGVLLDFFRARRVSHGDAFRPAPWSSMAPGQKPSSKVGDVYDPHSFGPSA